MNISCIYQIKNLLNNKCYVGSTSNYRKRKNRHIAYLRKGKHHCRHLQYAFNLYGESNFEFSIIEEVIDLSVLVARENWWIKELCPEYNILQEGTLNHLGLKRTEETRKKISVALTGREIGAATREKLRQISTGKVQSPITIQRKRESLFKPIFQTTMEGVVVKEWKSATEASENGYNRKCIYRCLWKKRPHYKGFMWVYKSS